MEDFSSVFGGPYNATGRNTPPGFRAFYSKRLQSFTDTYVSKNPRPRKPRYDSGSHQRRVYNEWQENYENTIKHYARVTRESTLSDYLGSAPTSQLLKDREYLAGKEGNYQDILGNTTAAKYNKAIVGRVQSGQERDVFVDSLGIAWAYSPEYIKARNTQEERERIQKLYGGPRLAVLGVRSATENYKRKEVA